LINNHFASKIGLMAEIIPGILEKDWAEIEKS